jgi:hypothetical protein
MERMVWWWIYIDLKVRPLFILSIKLILNLVILMGRALGSQAAVFVSTEVDL